MTTDSDLPSPTDTGWFTDADALRTMMEDERFADDKTLSSFTDAQTLIATFAASPSAGAWRSLDRATVAARLATLIAPTQGSDSGVGYRSLQQAGLNLCGPAALLMMAMGRDPVAVARYATDLFDTGSGSIGTFAVHAGQDLLDADFGAMSARGSISSQAEWMMLGAIRNTAQPFWQPQWRGDPDQELAGMTRPEELADWMRQTGIWSRVDDDGRWASNPGIPDATAIGMYAGTDTAVLLHTDLISGSTIVDSDTAPKEQSSWISELFPNHWVVLLSEVVPDLADRTLTLTIWTWGGRLRLRTPERVFIDNYFGTVSAWLR
ncbi:hypothetical protein H7J07_03500 [Mycobacterium koreense]|nr:hypothetical protein [Mycolicibacillus koreensis]MCV7247320.1 hypothetical protein [Mycolicibacillus koreensis]ODR10579.1 hypothetical protein BHQ15_03970 [Mycolicibacillus koreensis]BBY56511.1 hypothetical protein MKOR_37620 [Mycolicibacillus koreensis]